MKENGTNINRARPKKKKLFIIISLILFYLKKGRLIKI